MSMNQEERMHLIEAVFEKIPEEVTRKEKRYFAIHLFSVFLCYFFTLGIEGRKEKKKKPYLSEEEIDKFLYQRILANCDDTWHPELSDYNTNKRHQRNRQKMLE